MDYAKVSLLIGRLVMKLDLTSFEKALSSFERGLKRALATPEDEELRDACILRFEFSFELSWKMLKRQLENEIGISEEVDSYGKKQLFRIGGEMGLIKNVEGWFDYLEKRNISTHTYDQGKAEKVFSVLEAFGRDANTLLANLRSKND
jgi:nucleotidyltransferase substrate binding protein (TIGR01987 family)